MSNLNITTSGPIGRSQPLISENLDKLQRTIAEAQLPSPGGSGTGVIAPPPSAATLEESLFNARAAFKIKTAAVAMHLDRTWRVRLFRQLDSLLDAEEWDLRDEPVTEASFATFIRMLLYLNPVRRPGLGATADGHLIAAWTEGKDRLTIECLPDDQIRWVVVRYFDGQRESAAGKNSSSRLQTVLAPYEPQVWFCDEGTKSPR